MSSRNSSLLPRPVWQPSLAAPHRSVTQSPSSWRWCPGRPHS